MRFERQEALFDVRQQRSLRHMGIRRAQCDLVLQNLQRPHHLDRQRGALVDFDRFRNLFVFRMQDRWQTVKKQA